MYKAKASQFKCVASASTDASGVSDSRDESELLHAMSDIRQAAKAVRRVGAAPRGKARKCPKRTGIVNVPREFSMTLPRVGMRAAVPGVKWILLVVGISSPCVCGCTDPTEEMVPM
jgi:hypothetical protein